MRHAAVEHGSTLQRRWLRRVGFLGGGLKQGGAGIQPGAQADKRKWPQLWEAVIHHAHALDHIGAQAAPAIYTDAGGDRIETAARSMP